MEKDFKPVRSVYKTNKEVITNIMSLYNIEQFDLDCTYSKGNFWKGLPEPKNKSDIYPVNDTVINATSENLPFEGGSMSSVMYDPPFVVVGKSYKDNKEGSSIIAKRFEGYETYRHLVSNYYLTLKELYRVTSNNGYVVVKCQDTVSGGKNHFSHVMVMNMAVELGFYPKDMFVLLADVRINSFGSKWKKQEHARKYHSYFWVFQKTKPKVSYDYKEIISSFNNKNDFKGLDKFCLDLSLKLEDTVTYELSDKVIPNGHTREHYWLYYKNERTRVLVTPELVKTDNDDAYNELINLVAESLYVEKISKKIGLNK